MKTILATIKPRHLENILSGAKTAEIRKTTPRTLYPFFRVLLCESGSGGQIKGEFTAYAIPSRETDPDWPDMVRRACVTEEEAARYAGGGTVYFWLLSDVINYATAPGYRVQNISEYAIKRPPQSWQYISRT